MNMPALIFSVLQLVNIPNKVSLSFPNTKRICIEQPTKCFAHTLYTPHDSIDKIYLYIFIVLTIFYIGRFLGTILAYPYQNSLFFKYYF